MLCYNYVFQSKRLLIHWAALGGHTELVSFLISKGQDVDAKDDVSNL